MLNLLPQCREIQWSLYAFAYGERAVWDRVECHVYLNYRSMLSSLRALGQERIRVEWKCFWCEVPWLYLEWAKQKPGRLNMSASYVVFQKQNIRTPIFSRCGSWPRKRRQSSSRWLRENDWRETMRNICCTKRAQCSINATLERITSGELRGTCWLVLCLDMFD